jgi:hypothetical protein
MNGFVGLGVKPDVVLPRPPEGGPQPWTERPAEIRTLLQDFKTYDLDRDRLAAFERCSSSSAD